MGMVVALTNATSTQIQNYLQSDTEAWIEYEKTVLEEMITIKRRTR